MLFPNYAQYRIKVKNGPDIALAEVQEIVMSELADMPFETFETNDTELLAYIPVSKDEEQLLISIANLEWVESVEKIFIKGENWNRIWESSFEPIRIAESVIIRAPFHPVEKGY